MRAACFRRNFQLISSFCFWRCCCFRGFSFLVRSFLMPGRGTERAWGVGCAEGRSCSKSSRVSSPHRARAGRRARRAVRQQLLQEPAASWLHPVHLHRPKPGPLQVQVASALFRTRVTSPLRARLTGDPDVTCGTLACENKVRSSLEAWRVQLLSLYTLTANGEPATRLLGIYSAWV